MTTTAVSQHQTKWWSGGKSPFNLEYGKLMMWYFLMSDAFTFGAFLISYGPYALPVMHGLIRTMYLMLSLVLVMPICHWHL